MPGGAGWRALRLDDLEPLPWQDRDLSWVPLRHALGLRIVGIAAFTAERAGQEVVEPHTEDDGGRGHEELYVVLRGRASFVLDGVELDAPAGTFVRVDPPVRRQAVAAEPDTAVLALGGPPVFEPSASEWIERARPHVGTDRARARGMIDELRAARPGSPGIAIGEALLAVGAGDHETAREYLRAVVAEHPELRRPLESDPDLGGLVADV
ncbi:MAG TPA: hypothetical protein VGF25_19630 [Thermoleophilaceae bacterium]